MQSVTGMVDWALNINFISVLVNGEISTMREWGFSGHFRIQISIGKY